MQAASFTPSDGNKPLVECPSLEIVTMKEPFVEEKPRKASPNNVAGNRQRNNFVGSLAEADVDQGTATILSEITKT